MDYEQIYKSESMGSEYSVGVDIRIASPVGKTEGVQIAARKAADLLEQAVTREFYINNKEAQERALAERVDLINCFPEYPVFVQSIPNGYCSRACCEHKPWFKIATRIGLVAIGWRKRVIVIDWSDTTAAASAKDLFPGEDVTKDGRMIHAWSYEKAQEYINTLLSKG